MLGLQELIAPLAILCIIAGVISWKGREWFKNIYRSFLGARQDVVEINKEFKKTRH